MNTPNTIAALFRPKPLSHYRQLTTGGRITVDLTQDEAAVALKAYDRGVHILDPEEIDALNRLIGKLKSEIWP